LYTHLRSLFVAGLLICLLPCNLSANTPPIRVSIAVEGDIGENARIVSALSHEFRKLDGVSVTDTQPALKISCGVITNFAELIRDTSRRAPTGYASSIAVTTADDRFITHFVFTDSDIDSLAHRIAVAVDGGVIEKMRRAAQPSSSP
jgi:hypothetical protein